jgi:hypothetical protein
MYFVAFIITFVFDFDIFELYRESVTSHGSTLDRRVYQLVPHPPVSERILASKAILVDDRGQAYLQLYCQGLESLGIHQTINSRLPIWSLDQHMQHGFLASNTSMASWSLEDVNLNEHGGDEMEYSLVRDWVENIDSMNL